MKKPKWFYRVWFTIPDRVKDEKYDAQAGKDEYAAVCECQEYAARHYTDWHKILFRTERMWVA